MVALSHYPALCNTVLGDMNAKCLLHSPWKRGLYAACVMLFKIHLAPHVRCIESHGISLTDASGQLSLTCQHPGIAASVWGKRENEIPRMSELESYPLLFCLLDVISESYFQV